MRRPIDAGSQPRYDDSTAFCETSGGIERRLQILLAGIAASDHGNPKLAFGERQIARRHQHVGMPVECRQLRRIGLVLESRQLSADRQ